MHLCPGGKCRVDSDNRTWFRTQLHSSCSSASCICNRKKLCKQYYISLKCQHFC